MHLNYPHHIRKQVLMKTAQIILIILFLTAFFCAFGGYKNRVKVLYYRTTLSGIATYTSIALDFVCTGNFTHCTTLVDSNIKTLYSYSTNTYITLFKDE